MCFDEVRLVDGCENLNHLSTPSAAVQLRVDGGFCQFCAMDRWVDADDDTELRSSKKQHQHQLHGQGQGVAAVTSTGLGGFVRASTSGPNGEWHATVLSVHHGVPQCPWSNGSMLLPQTTIPLVGDAQVMARQQSRSELKSWHQNR